ncbi:MAG: alpha/beta fold hydrolase [Kangiellaceae bacterium]
MNKNELENYLFLLTHGAGAGVKSDFIRDMVCRLNQVGLQTVSFNFPYMKIMEETGKRRPPDRMPKLIDAFKQQIDACRKEFPDKKIIIGGKSMGGRAASLVTAEYEREQQIAACICLGFPFHPPKKLDKYRGEHLSSIRIPTLILQGERDTFGTQSEVDAYDLSEAVKVKYIPDGDHSFKPRVKSGFTLDGNVELCCKNIIDFINAISKS